MHEKTAEFITELRSFFHYRKFEADLSAFFLYFITKSGFIRLVQQERIIMKKRIHTEWIIYLAVFAVFLYIGYRVPYCHDEWQWGLDKQIELMKSGFKNYNGRYLGNILALIITRSVLAKAAVLSLGVVWLLNVLYRNVTQNQQKNRPEINLMVLLFLTFFILAVPSTLFQQSYGWPAAFVNFVPPVILFLIYYGWTEELYIREQESYTRFQTLSVIPLGIAVQLFSEHITVFVVAYAVWILVYTAIKYKKVHAVQINFLWASVVGAVIMFSNGAYSRAADGSDGYKEIHTTFAGMVEQFVSKIWYHLLLNNWILNTALICVLLFLIIKKSKKNVLSVEMTLVFCGYGVYSAFHKIYPKWVFDSSEMLNHGINTALSVLFFVNVLLCIWLYADQKQKLSICILYLSSAAVAMPLLAANPIGARCFYVSYIFQTLAVVKLIQSLIRNSKLSFFYPLSVMGMAVCVLAVIYMRMFLAIGQVNDYRAELIQSGVQQGQKEIVLPILPYQEYCWQTVPPSEVWEERFKEFYHIPDDVTVRFE